MSENSLCTESTISLVTISLLSICRFIPTKLIPFLKPLKFSLPQYSLKAIFLIGAIFSYIFLTCFGASSKIVVCTLFILGVILILNILINFKLSINL